MCMRWRALYLQRSFASVALLSAKVDLGQAEIEAEDGSGQVFLTALVGKNLGRAKVAVSRRVCATVLDSKQVVFYPHSALCSRRQIPRNRQAVLRLAGLPCPWSRLAPDAESLVKRQNL